LEGESECQNAPDQSCFKNIGLTVFFTDKYLIEIVLADKYLLRHFDTLCKLEPKYLMQTPHHSPAKVGLILGHCEFWATPLIQAVFLSIDGHCHSTPTIVMNFSKHVSLIITH